MHLIGVVVPIWRRLVMIDGMRVGTKYVLTLLGLLLYGPLAVGMSYLFT